MAKVRRLNVTLDVSDDEVDYYIGLGYDHINEDGSIIKRAIPKDIATLQRAYVENEKTIKQLTAKIANLEDKIKQLQKTASKETEVSKRTRTEK